MAIMEVNKDTIKTCLYIAGILLFAVGTGVLIAGISHDLHANVPNWHDPKDVELIRTGFGLMVGGTLISVGTLGYSMYSENKQDVL